MKTQWTIALLTWLTLTQFVVSGPGYCPRLSGNCYYDDVAKLLPLNSGQYFAVGGLFDVHKQGGNAFTCGSEFNPAGILHTQAFLWSLNYWQNGSTSVSVGAVVFDSCERKAQLIHNLLGFEQCNLRVSWINRHNVVGYVGPTSNMDALAAAKLSADMQLTVISPVADTGLLSDAGKFPFFLRTTPTIQTDIDIMAYMLTHVGTQYVAVIYQESMQGEFASFQTKMRENRICVSGSYSMTGDEESGVVRDFVRGPLAQLAPVRFVALFVSPEFLESFLSHVSAEDDVRSLDLVFLLTSHVRLNSNVFQGQHAVAASNAIVLERAEPESVEAAVREFRNYWKQDSILSSMAQNTRLSDPFLVQYLSAGNRLPDFDVDAAYTIMATKAFVEGVKQAGQVSGCDASAYLCPQFFDSDDRGSIVYRHIRGATNFFTPPGVGGAAFADGDLRREVVRYNIYRYLMNGTLLKIGEYKGSTSPSLTHPLRDTRPYAPGQCQDTPCPQCSTPFTTPTAPLTTSTPPTTTPRRCWTEEEEEGEGGNYTRVYYPPEQEITGAYLQGERSGASLTTRFEIGQRWIIALGVMAGLGVLAVMAFEVYILYKLLGTRIAHRWRTLWLGQLLLLGILLCYLTLFAFLFVPTKETCAITRFGVGVSYSVCFAVLLVKLLVIMTSRSAAEAWMVPGEGESTSNYLRGVYQFLMVIFVVGVQVVIDAQWLITVPPEAVRVRSNVEEEVWVCNHYTFRAARSLDAMTRMSSFVRTEFENHLLSLVYVMFLLLLTTLLSLCAHGITTNHRESVFIGIAAGFSIPIWLAWTLVGGLNTDHDFAHEFGDACIAFGLFLTATLILFAMFLPKVRQLGNMGVENIYFEDDRDTVYGGSIIVAPDAKPRPKSIIYVNQGIYSEPVVLGGGEGGYVNQSSLEKPTPSSTYSAPPAYLKRGGDSTSRGGSVLRVTDDLSGRRPLEKRATSEMGHRAGGRAPSARGTLPRSRSQTSLGAL